VAELRGACGPARTPVVDGGETRFERLCPGRATLVVDLPGCVRLERTVTVPASGELSLGTLELRAGGGAQGEVLDADGEPVAGAVLSLEGHPEEPLGRTGRRGEFTVPSLPQGDVSIQATHPSLGSSTPVAVRVLRGTVARGVLLRMERSARDGARAVLPRAVALEEGDGVTVRGVLPGSAAERAGLRAGDRVVSVGATPVTTVREAERRMTGPPGDEVVLEVERDGRRRTVRFVRESR
jgi:S1-C subfamily serine protease